MNCCCVLRKALVTIKRISRWEFNLFLPKHFFLESIVGEEVAWWADDARSIIGTIARGAAEPSWRYILLERNGDGDFRVCILKAGIKTRLAASVQLLHAMEAVRKSRHHAPLKEAETLTAKSGDFALQPNSTLIRRILPTKIPEE